MLPLDSIAGFFRSTGPHLFLTVGRSRGAGRPRHSLTNHPGVPVLRGVHEKTPSFVVSVARCSPMEVKGGLVRVQPDGMLDKIKERQEPLPHSRPSVGHGLVRDAISGCQDSLCNLLTLARDQAYRQTVARVEDSDEAEDVAQEVMIRVFRSIHTFRFQSSFLSWVYRITENQLCAEFRSKAAARRKSRRSGRLKTPSQQVSRTATWIDAEKLWDAVGSATRCLPELQNRAFGLVVFQGLEPHEVARALGKSQTNIRSSLSRARAKVRKRLEETAPAMLEDLKLIEPRPAP